MSYVVKTGTTEEGNYMEKRKSIFTRLMVVNMTTNDLGSRFIGKIRRRRSYVRTTK